MQRTWVVGRSNRRRVRCLAVVVVALPLGVLGVGAPAGAAATKTVALYQMNEAAGATVLVDSSGSGLHGTIGSEVVEGTVVSGATAHRFTYLKPNTPPAHPGHLDTVPNTSKLDPGTSDYAVSMRVKWTHNFGNMIQKGQSGGSGGYFKWEAPSGVVKCLFRDSAGVSKTGQLEDPVERRPVAHDPLRTHGGRRDDDRRRRRAQHRPGQDRQHLEPEAAHDRRQGHLRPDHGDVRLLRRRHRLGPHREGLNRTGQLAHERPARAFTKP